MNRIWLIGIPIATVALAGYLIFFGRPQQTVVTLQIVTSSPPAQAQSEIDAEQLRSAQLQQQLTDARAEAARNEQKARALAATLATNALSAPAVNPLKDPETRRAMEKQQLQALDRKIKQLVNADLVSKLNLTPEQATQLRDLLRQKQKPAMALMTGLMAGEFDDAQTTAAGTRVNQAIADADAQIRALLGPDGYSYLEQEEKMDDERNQVRMVKREFSDAGHPLRGDQQEQLLAAMSEERQKFQFQVNFHDPSSFDYSHFHDYFSEANLDRFYAEMQEVNTRIVARAQSFLDAEQFADFQRVMQEHLERGRATVKMTQALFPMKKRP